MESPETSPATTKTLNSRSRAAISTAVFPRLPHPPDDEERTRFPIAILKEEEKEMEQRRIHFILQAAEPITPKTKIACRSSRTEGTGAGRAPSKRQQHSTPLQPWLNSFYTSFRFLSDATDPTFPCTIRVWFLLGRTQQKLGWRNFEGRSEDAIQC